MFVGLFALVCVCGFSYFVALCLLVGLVLFNCLGTCWFLLTFVVLVFWIECVWLFDCLWVVVLRWGCFALFALAL